MKTSYQTGTILNEMENLIAYSCQSSDISTEKFDTFHSALIKKHFGALEANINRETKTLELKVAVRENNYAHINITYKSLENFLKSCLEDDLGSLAFYQNMLTFYNVGISE